MDGIFVLRKSEGKSSMQAVSRLRYLLKQKSMGHMGTLDPMASGVLLVGVGKGTKLFDYFLKKDKVYEAEFLFGCSTDTLDTQGEITATSNTIPDMDEIRAALAGLCGKVMQVPPAYSAKHINGVRAYKLARSGQSVSLPATEVEIFDLKLNGQTGERSFSFSIHCSAGTYIRSIARDLGTRLSTLAVMSKLIRTRCGRFSLEDAHDDEQIAANPESWLIPLSDALCDFPIYKADSAFHKKLMNGVAVDLVDAPTDEDFLLFLDTELLGIASVGSDNKTRIKTNLRST